MWRYTVVSHIFVIICVLYCSSLKVDINDDTYGQSVRYHGRHKPIRGHQIRKPRQKPPKRRQIGFDYYNSKNAGDNSSYEYYTSEEDSIEVVTKTTIGTTLPGAEPKLSKTTTTEPPPPEYDQNIIHSPSLGSNMGLTEEAWSSLLDQREALEEQERNVSKIVEQWTSRESYELNKKIRHYGTERMIVKSCYQIAATYLNADQDLRDYYKIRFLYNREMVYEIGYIVHEIVYKYTIVLELYHVVQARFYNVSQFHNLAPTTMMLQFYVNILHQCQQIMHLCNTLNEIEEKYLDVPDQEVEYGSDLDKHSSQEQMSEEARNEMERFQKRKQVRVKKIRKDRNKAVKSGRFTTTTRTRRPRTNSHFPIEYGWSIEDWGKIGEKK